VVTGKVRDERAPVVKNERTRCSVAAIQNYRANGGGANTFVVYQLDRGRNATVVKRVRCSVPGTITNITRLPGKRLPL